MALLSLSQTEIQQAMGVAGVANIADITLPRPSTGGYVEDARGNSWLYAKRRLQHLKVMCYCHWCVSVGGVLIVNIITRRKRKRKIDISRCWRTDKDKRQRLQKYLNWLTHLKWIWNLLSPTCSVNRSVGCDRNVWKSFLYLTFSSERYGISISVSDICNEYSQLFNTSCKDIVDRNCYNADEFLSTAACSKEFYRGRRSVDTSRSAVSRQI